MDFYESISAYYDLIFPVEEQTVSFLNASVEPGSRILDIACGTGGHSLALADKGHGLTGIDADRAMIAAAREKARGRELQTDFRVMDMLQMRGRFDPGFDMAFCIGNSLVHLQSDEQIYTLLADCRSLFKPGGRLILQIINYDRILAEGVTSLPALREESAGLEFVRNYELNPDRKSVIFHTELHVGRGTEHRVIENRIALRILTSEQLLALVRSAGFENPELFGGFDGRPFSLGSLPLILRAATS